MKLRVKMSDFVLKKAELETNGPRVTGITIRVRDTDTVALVAYEWQGEGQTLVFALVFDENGVGWLEREFSKGDARFLADLEALNVIYTFF